MRDFRSKFGIPNSSQSPDIGQNSYGGILDFPIFGQSLIKRIVITPEPVMIDIKLGPVTKLDKRNKTTSKKFYDDVILTNCDVIVIFPICG